MPADQRILVVEDAPEIGALIRRVLTIGGYQVDVAATLPQARGMSPGGYHAVLVDMRLGADNGLDLVREMLAAEPAAAARVLVMTGGPARSLPAGVGLLAKPFRPDELLAAVRAMPAPRAGGLRGSSPAAGPAQRPGAAAPIPAPPGAAPPIPAPPAAVGLLGLASRLRAHELGRLLDHLHDGPVQEIAAATLSAHVLRRGAPGPLAGQLTTLATRLDEAARGLRQVIDGGFLHGDKDLATELRKRTEWLLPCRLSVEVSQASPGTANARYVADLAELMLFAMTEGSPPQQAAAVISPGTRLFTVELTVTWQPGRCPPADLAGVRPALAGLAAALGTTAQAELTGHRWRAVIATPLS